MVGGETLASDTDCLGYVWAENDRSAGIYTGGGDPMGPGPP